MDANLVFFMTGKTKHRNVINSLPDSRKDFVYDSPDKADAVFSVWLPCEGWQPDIGLRSQGRKRQFFYGFNPSCAA
jgi:hypothetical protein